MSDSPAKTSPLLIAAAWIIVAIPLGWGLYQSIIKSKPLFSGVTATAPAAPAAAPAK